MRPFALLLVGGFGWLAVGAGCDKPKPAEPAKVVATEGSVASPAKAAEKKPEPVAQKAEPEAEPKAEPQAEPKAEPEAEAKPPGVKPDYVKCDPARPELPCTPDTPPEGLE